MMKKEQPTVANKPILCPNCGSFKIKKDYGDSYICEMCVDSFDLHETPIYPIRRRKGVKRVTCPQCGSWKVVSYIDNTFRCEMCSSKWGHSDLFNARKIGVSLFNEDGLVYENRKVQNEISENSKELGLYFLAPKMKPEILIPMEYKFIDVYSKEKDIKSKWDVIAKVSSFIVNNQKFGLYIGNHMVLPMIYNSIARINDNLICYSVLGKDEEGKQNLSKKYINSISTCVVKKEKGFYGFFNIRDRFHSNLYDDFEIITSGAYSSRCEVIKVKSGTKEGVLDSCGNILIPLGDNRVIRRKFYLDGEDYGYVFPSFSYEFLIAGNKLVELKHGNVLTINEKYTITNMSLSFYKKMYIIGLIAKETNDTQDNRHFTLRQDGSFGRPHALNTLDRTFYITECEYDLRHRDSSDWEGYGINESLYDALDGNSDAYWNID